MGFQIAIDGPVGSGKSTVAREVAKKLRFNYIDTGAMYRAIGFYALSHGIAISDERTLSESLDEIDIQLYYIEETQRVSINGEDVSGEIRSREVSSAASAVAVFAEIRKYVVNMSRKFASENNIVMDGRDTGSVVLPDAELKIYLDSSVEVRAKRRYDELVRHNSVLSFDDVVRETIARDTNDMTRAHSPLVKTDDAYYIDSTDLTLEETIKFVVCLAKKRGCPIVL